jgi:hypothetical protein
MRAQAPVGRTLGRPIENALDGNFAITGQPRIPIDGGCWGHWKTFQAAGLPFTAILTATDFR